ncbi:MAG TPA: GIY-YIG nuclease family protein [Phenylobacterium sp.]|jgi:hypothetical protein|uniref:GIY-YIG nuclease family protein n=1 Tax=Phenylobacterium sp. TaxID=1871053 RepID=UPI002C98ED0E|nr:GIY-YIG nuclease family protein [Phenylobacterium sp.]HXA37632.1 GIY-YIG nuclease family protein [Phenylobacterium sp.]
MDKPNRRQAVRDYKERKVALGIFAVRCAATGEAWVGVSRDLAQQQNRVWFGLKTGGHPNRALQAAWAQHGEAAFSFEVLEAAQAEDLGEYERANMLKAREAHWRAELAAAKISG